ncbi:F-box/kelch-repeat protein At3g23880-like [Salvia miltiorrhiza]|uniref:F-box/kelch-repeat protein At3g23880-like n=1 Tax=Salvia miltiorrhiza TaxID=226208 RepID=UPI0025ACFD2F|nr:F-box/kelch-repeat protein At3g23880-like [Salvia miltiorrhiza]
MEIAKSSRKSLHLPGEIIEEIQSRLPVKSLLRFRCVSKLWLSLIGSKRFIKTQYQNSIKNPFFPHQRVIIHKDLSANHVQCSLLSVLSELTNTIPLSPLADPINTTLSMGYEIVGSCNGLLCLRVRDEQSRIHLWNPSTRISKKLPEISNRGYVMDLGFCWVESSNEYKLFVGLRNFDYYQQEIEWVCKVYSSKTKSWKTSEHCADLVLCCLPGVFAGGKLYWRYYGYKEIDIIFLDLKSEVIGRIELPFDHEFCRKQHWFVGVLGGLLCVLCHTDSSREVVRVWVMKEEAWKRVATFANLVELLQPPPLMAVGLKTEISVNCGSILLVYDHGDNVFRSHEVCSGYRSHVYVESLVSPEDL